MKKLFLIFIFAICAQIFAKGIKINKIEPPNWWTNLPYNNIQLLIYGENLDSLNCEFNSQYIKVNNIDHSSNGTYAFIDITINKDIQPAIYQLTFSKNNRNIHYSYPILDRDTSKNIHQGFSSKDVVYLIFADRFCNGDTSNDFLSNEKEEFEFGSLNGRHGGDIQGISNKLNYLDDLGITSIWITPMLENNMYMSYHGYAATDFYRIDPRFGTIDSYKNLIKTAHSKGLKIIMDHVSNHIGINHIWTFNPPTKTWINGTVERHLHASHNKIAFLDIHGDSSTINKTQTGWFENYMPDLNQKDPNLAKYLVQNSIWWIETLGIDGIREDTYPYNDQEYMSEWSKTIFEIYPNFNIVGEVWKGEPTFLAKYQSKSYLPRKFDSNLPVVTDFAFRDMIFGYLLGEKTLYNIYELFAKDFIYSNPNNLLVFIDNHDIDRAMYAAKWNIHKFEVALTILLTTRGIPQILYGTEFGMDGGGHHGRIRAPYPTGFDKESKKIFPKEKVAKIKEIYQFTKKLLNLRKRNKVLSDGKLIHFPPNDGIYIYKKILCTDEILFIIKDNEGTQSINISDYMNTNGSNILHELLTDDIIKLDQHQLYELNGKTIKILRL